MQMDKEIQRLLISVKPRRPTDFESANDANLVYPGIYISSWTLARNLRQLKSAGVTHVLNCAEGSGFGQCSAAAQRVEYEKSGIKYLGIAANDVMGYDLKQHFEQTTAFIKEARTDEKNIVLVHCYMGYSRSAAIVLAYLMIDKGMTLGDAVNTVRSSRDVRPNNGFMKQLTQLESELGYAQKPAASL